MLLECMFEHAQFSITWAVLGDAARSIRYGKENSRWCRRISFVLDPPWRYPGSVSYSRYLAVMKTDLLRYAVQMLLTIVRLYAFQIDSTYGLFDKLLSSVSIPRRT